MSVIRGARTFRIVSKNLGSVKMRIVHLCLGNYFADGYSYQENMFTKFHMQEGHEVYVIASLQTYDANGKVTFMEMRKPYLTEHGVEVTRIPYKKDNKIYRKIRKFKGLAQALEAKAPEVLFIHNCQFADMKKVVKYLKDHPEVKVYCDSHADYSNSATNWFSKNILHKILWRRSAKLIEPFATKFYGVLPARVEFLKELYKLPAEKCELLVMGADDDLVEANLKPEVKAEIRKKYGIADDDFLLMFGGKIDLFKQQLLLLMDAVNEIDNPKLKLIVFGSVVPEMKEAIEARVSDKVKYIGWVQSDESYPLFASCDLAVFPGRHSVFWEQVTGQGIPLLVKHWDGTTHVDIGGNVKFLYDDSKEEIKNAVLEIVNNPSVYAEMKRVAEENGMKVFSYRDIARRSIEEV